MSRLSGGGGGGGKLVAVHSFDVNQTWNSSSAFADSSVQFNVPNVSGKIYSVICYGMSIWIADAGNAFVFQWEGNTLGGESAQHSYRPNAEENIHYQAVPPNGRGGFVPNEQVTLQGVVNSNTKVVTLRCPLVIKVYEE